MSQESRLQITPGVRQDHKGNLYRVASWNTNETLSPLSSKTISVPAKDADMARPFRLALAHIWNFPAKGPGVAEKCLSGCSVCVPKVQS